MNEGGHSMDEKVKKLVQEKLSTGEIFLYGDRSHGSVLGGIFIMLLTAFSGIYGPIMMIIHTGINASSVIVLIFMIPLDFMMLRAGYYTATASRKNCFFVTNQKLAIRGTSFWWKSLDRDIPLSGIEEVIIRDVNVRAGSSHTVRQYLEVKVRNENKRIPFHPANVQMMLSALQRLITQSS